MPLRANAISQSCQGQYACIAQRIPAGTLLELSAELLALQEGQAWQEALYSLHRKNDFSCQATVSASAEPRALSVEVVPAGRRNAAAQLASSCGANVLKHSQAGSLRCSVRTLALYWCPSYHTYYSVHSRAGGLNTIQSQLC